MVLLTHQEQYIVPGRTCPSSFSEFQAVTEKDVMDLVTRSKIKACMLVRSIASYYYEGVLLWTSSSFQNHHKLVVIYWGHARPLLKRLKADFEQFSSFRPVSNLKFLSKLIEKSACLQLNKYLVNNNLHEPLQSAYKVGHSSRDGTETALLAITDDILLSLDRGENVFLVLLDLSAAFDTVNHSRLLSRLQDTFGIQGTVLKSFESYLTNRGQLWYVNLQLVFLKVPWKDLYCICFILHHLLMSYDHIAPRLWNSIPNDIRNITNIQTLKTKLKTYFFKKYLDNSPLF